MANQQTGKLNFRLPAKFIETLSEGGLEALEQMPDMNRLAEDRSIYDVFLNGHEKSLNGYNPGRIVTAILKEKHDIFHDIYPVVVSGKNPVPGFRRMLFFGEKFISPSGDYDLETPFSYGIVKITDDGRYEVSQFTPDAGHDEIPCETFRLSMAAGEEKEWTRDGLGYMYMQLDSFLEDYGLDAGLQDDAKRIFKTMVTGYFGKIRQIVADELGPEVMDVVTMADMVDDTHISWLSGGDNASAQTCRLRQQQMRACPGLASFLFYRPDCCSAIDAGEPLLPMIAEKFGVSEKRAARLFDIPVNSIVSPRTLVDLPEYAVPQTARQYEQIGFLEKANSFLYDGILSDGRILGDMPSGAEFWPFLEQAEKADMNNIRRAVDFLATRLYLPAMLNKVRDEIDSRGETWDYKYRSLPTRMLRESEKVLTEDLKIGDLPGLCNALDGRKNYHCMDLLDTTFIDYDWSGMFGNITLENGCTARELTTAVDLRACDRAENFPEQGYFSSMVACCKDDVAVLCFSIERDDEFLGTAIFRCSESEKGNKLKISGFRIFNTVLNTSCGIPGQEKEAHKAVSLIEKRIKQGRLKQFRKYMENLEPFMAKYKTGSDIHSLISRPTYNAWNRDRFDLAFSELSKALPSHIRNAGPDALIARMPLDDVILRTVPAGTGPDNLWTLVDENGHYKRHASADAELQQTGSEPVF